MSYGMDGWCKTNNDTISRQETIDALGERPMVWTESDYELGARNQYDADVLALEALPSASPEHTHMVINKSKGGTTMWYQCAKCGEPSDLKDKYCRCCGRRFSNEDN